MEQICWASWGVNGVTVTASAQLDELASLLPVEVCGKRQSHVGVIPACSSAKIRSDKIIKNWQLLRWANGSGAGTFQHTKNRQLSKRMCKAKLYQRSRLLLSSCASWPVPWVKPFKYVFGYKLTVFVHTGSELDLFMLQILVVTASLFHNVHQPAHFLPATAHSLNPGNLSVAAN